MHKRAMRTFILFFIVGVVSSFLLTPTVAIAEQQASDSSVHVYVTHDPTESIFDNLSESERSWYGSSLEFSGTHIGSKRYYDGNNIGIEMRCYQTGTYPCDTHFSVELHRSNYIWEDTYIGSAAFNRSGFTKATWTNVGGGTYFFKFVKCNDNMTVRARNVAMYSW